VTNVTIVIIVTVMSTLLAITTLFPNWLSGSA
jgi:hypothetical protein